ncbi:MAG: hypothetical protein J6Z80_05710, partial [Clostridia bacterium]|nr:hypothetical protein [Clostridia bacterium]
SVRRHATSKIRRAEDLDGIVTLGFRGEALAAISSVSRFSILTKRPEDMTGTLVRCRDGEVADCTEAGCPDGTTISAEDLFSNVPARRKFLRRDITETAAVTAVVEKIALSRPDIGIRYITDNVLRFSTPGDGKLISAIYVTLGRDFASKLIPVDDLTDGITVKGYIGTPENCRGSRSCENFFINGRFVRCQTAAAALEQAFSSYIPKEKFPCAVINISFNPAFVDVNVHPQKLEVKFSNEKPVFNAVFCAVRNALTEKIPRPTDDGLRYTGDSRKLFNEIITSKAASPEEAMKIAADRDRLTARYEQLVIPREEPRATAETPPAPPGQRDVPADEPEQKTRSADPAPETFETETDRTAGGIAPERDDDAGPSVGPEIPEYRIAGVLFGCYIFVELGDRMIVVDKHAAHERINYEKLRSRMDLGTPPSQKLLLPIEPRLTPSELEAAAEFCPELSRMGFEFSEGKISAYPSGMSAKDAAELFCLIVSRLAEGTGDPSADRMIYYEKALYQASCKASVKAGEDDLPENLDWIVRQVLTDPKIKYCPHGRPVAFESDKKSFERRFERK